MNERMDDAQMQIIQLKPFMDDFRKKFPFRLPRSDYFRLVIVP